MQVEDEANAGALVADLRRRAQLRMLGVWRVMAAWVPISALINHHGHSWGTAVGDALTALVAVVVLGGVLIAVWRLRPSWLDLPAVLGTDRATRRHITRVVAGTSRPRGPVDRALAGDSARLALRVNTAISVLPAAIVLTVMIAVLSNAHRGAGERVGVGVAIGLVVVAMQWGHYVRRACQRRAKTDPLLPIEI